VIPRHAPAALVALALGIVLASSAVLAHRVSVTSTRARDVRLGVATGIDVLEAENFARLTDRRVALLTNLAAHTRTGITTLDAFRSARNLQVVALFTPEHGMTATIDGRVASGRDERTGLPVFSLYGESRRPAPSMLAGVDVVVIDLPDVGVRFYTYATTMAYVLEEAAKHDVEVLVLDRPNPINGRDVEGPTLDASMASFTGYFPMPVRHGLTLGELARVFNGERRLGARLSVAPVQGWRRDLWFDQTDLAWHDPSPNIRSLTEATLYPGIGAIESSNLSVGRGTPTPFEVVGAPWIDGAALARALTRRDIPGVRFSATTFVPDSSTYARQRCFGVSLSVTDRTALKSLRLGVEIAEAVWRLYPTRYDFGSTAQMFGDHVTVERIVKGDDPRTIAQSWNTDEDRWRETRRQYLLYP
jgi:uncharacterized protein YbbC (DUF1343 family)